jgi:hypothetical protein
MLGEEHTHVSNTAECQTACRHVQHLPAILITCPADDTSLSADTAGPLWLRCNRRLPRPGSTAPNPSGRRCLCLLPLPLLLLLPAAPALTPLLLLTPPRAGCVLMSMSAWCCCCTVTVANGVVSLWTPPASVPALCRSAANDTLPLPPLPPLPLPPFNALCGTRNVSSGPGRSA